MLCQNYRSVLGEDKEKVDAIIQREIDAGHYKIVYERPTIISALGAVPKSDGGIRLIHDCSMPEGLGVNHYATIEKQSFMTVRDAVALPLAPRAPALRSLSEAG